MGVLGGLLRLESPHSFKPRSSIFCCFGRSDTLWTGLAQEWATALDRESFIVTLSFLAVCIGEVLSGNMIGSALWFQLMLP